MDEIWKAIPGYEGLYDASNLGRVKSYYTGRVLKPDKTKNGYYQINLYNDGKKKTFFLHRLVYEAFNGDIQEGLVIDHEDGCKSNNNLSNLRCVTQKENINNKNTLTDEWRKKTAEAVRKANNKSVVQIDKTTGQTIRRWNCMHDVERALGINNADISRCCTGKRKTAGGFKWRFES